MPTLGNMDTSHVKNWELYTYFGFTKSNSKNMNKHNGNNYEVPKNEEYATNCKLKKPFLKCINQFYNIKNMCNIYSE